MMRKFTLSLDLALAQLDEIALIAHPQFNFQLFYGIGMFVTGILLFHVIGIIVMIASSAWAVVSVRRFKRNRKFRRVFFSADDISFKVYTLIDKAISKHGHLTVYRLILRKENGDECAEILSVDVDSHDFEKAVINEICYVVSGKTKNFGAKYAFPSAIYVPDETIVFDNDGLPNQNHI